MKILVKFLFVALCASLLFSCAKDEVLFEEQGDLALKKASKAIVFVVEPTGVDDTQNIIDAFEDAMNEGTGSVIQLTEGEFHVGFMEIRDFCGTLKGAGKGKTIITAMNNLDAQAVMDQNLKPDLIKFVGGDVLLSHFSIRTPPGKLTISGTSKGNIRCLINFSATNANYEFGNQERSINVNIDNVCVSGQFLENGVGYKKKYNVFYGLRTGWDCMQGSNVSREKIHLKITNSEINTCVYGLVLEGMTNSKVAVGKKGNGNIFSHLDQSGGVWESRNMEVLVEGNIFNVPAFSWGFDLCNVPYYSILKEEPQTKATLCNIQNNVFNMAHSEYALWMHDYRRVTHPEEMPLAIQVKNNQFNMTDYWDWGIISRRTKGIVIRNNKFSGNGGMAIYCDSFGGYVYNEDGLILGNNFSTAELDCVVYLSGDTKNWTIVGGDLGESVLDYGENNLISGFNNNTSNVPFGQTISDKLKKMRIPMHNLK